MSLGTPEHKPEPNERGGTRVPSDICVTLTSHDPRDPFSETCQIILVNLQGCAARSAKPIRIGTVVNLQGLPSKDDVRARVVNCFSLGKFERLWILGLALDKPGNVWGIENVPDDWKDNGGSENFWEEGHPKRRHLRKQA